MLWLILCYAASVVSPLKMPYLAVLSITTPFALAGNLFFLFFWLLTRRKWLTVLPIITLVVSYQLLTAVFGWHISSSIPAAQEGDFKVMAWNVHGVGVFDKPQQRYKDDSIIAFLNREAADILVMPEYYTIYSNALMPYSTRILKQCNYKDYRFVPDNTLGTKIYLGIAIFSKFPIVNFESRLLDKGVMLAIADVKINEQKTIRVFGVHLQSFLLADKEKEELEQVKHRHREIDIQQSKSYLSRFANAYVKRAAQAETIAALITESPYPVLLCGDFNDVPASYTYGVLRKQLSDAFIQRNFGLGRTYNLFSPTLRIDYIFYDPLKLKLLQSSRLHTTLSDHNPVTANFRLGTTP